MTALALALSLAALPPGAPAPAAERAGEAAEVVRARIGHGQADLAFCTEGAGQAPMGLAVSGAEVYVLDQCSARVQVYSASRWVRSIPIGKTTYRDLARAPDGRLALLDHLVERAVVVLAPSGRRLGAVRLQGPGLAEAGAAQRVEWRADGIWVRVEGGAAVQVADAAGAAVATRSVEPPLRMRDGLHVLRAETRGLAYDLLHVEVVGPDGRVVRDTPIRFPGPVAAVEVFEDRDGSVRVVTSRDDAPGDAGDELAVLDRHGAVVRRIPLPRPAVRREEETGRTLFFTDDGALYRMTFGRREVVIRRYGP